ncbi:PREDICTED: 3-keto-steroid reductase-like [Priapulus caudatus]|uniref:3-keto-steroid reductase-like n=1 Tax=Priapulus caudatus TaxID=37621 RepID=A0ABM1EQN2_PRICU|nr:PREDICTED: 3-keto-steroid reductase-like [Priapulus caudatus]
MTLSDQKVALVTGANGGVGLALCERMLAENPKLKLILACRNLARAIAAKKVLTTGRPAASVDIVLMDVSSVASVYRAAREISQAYDRLDYLFLNAGFMKVTHVDWQSFFGRLFTAQCVEMLATGKGLLVQDGQKTPEGLQAVFATNLFGHYVLLREVDALLRRGARVVWTSSVNASSAEFDIADVQCARGAEPYASSKHAVDLTSVALSERWRDRGVHSHVTCPGLVLTNLTYGILPRWFWTLIVPLLYLMRVFLPSNTIDPYHGSEAHVWVANQRAESLDPALKYCSRVSVLGNAYTDALKLDVTLDEGEHLLDQLSQLELDMRQKFKK